MSGRVYNNTIVESIYNQIKDKLVLMPKVLNTTIGQHMDCSQRVVRLRQYDIKLATKPN